MNKQADEGQGCLTTVSLRLLDSRFHIVLSSNRVTLQHETAAERTNVLVTQQNVTARTEAHALHMW